MRNLKRALSLTLASVMLLGMMVVGSSAAGYDDVKETDNVEAIEVLQAIGVMVGDERGFGPDRPVNRAEMAVVMSLLLKLDYNYYVSSCPFNDVYDWARGPVGACYANKIVSGRGEGVYDPGSTVTAVEAASMLMRALGYFQYSNDYEGGFELATVREGTKIGIFDGVGSSATEPMTRNQVAQIVLNALQSGVVEPDGNTINLTTPDGSVLTGKVNYVYVTSNKDFAKAISKTPASSMGSYNDAPIVELGERLYDGKLQLTDDTDVFGRPSRKWEYDGKAIGTYAKKELLDKEYVGEVTGKDLFDLLGAATIKDYDTYVYVDGVWTDDTGAQTALGGVAPNGAFFNANDMNKNNKARVGLTGNGVKTEVYVDHDKDEVYVAVINTYLAIATKDYDEKKEQATIRAYSIEKSTAIDEYVKAEKNGNKDVSFNLEVEDFPSAKDVKKDEAFLITVADNEVQSFKPAEVLSGVTISAFSVRNSVTVDGTKYNYATTAGYKASDLANWTNITITNLKDRTYNVYLDAYGNLIGAEEVDAPKNYVFITGIDMKSSNRVNQTADASAIFIDGTMETIKVNMTKSTLYTNGDDRDSILNTWCTYTKNGDVYTVKEVTKVDAAGNGRPSSAYGNTTGLAQYNGGGLPTYKIDAKNYRLAGKPAAAVGSDFSSVYGDKDTVYLTAKLGELYRSDDAGKNWGIIKDVASVVTGIENANIEVWTGTTPETKADLDNGKIAGTPAAAQTARGVYTLYNDDGIIIAAVIVGEDAGTAKDLVYVHSSDLEEEIDNGGSGKAAGDGLWTWTRKVIRNGEEVLLTEVGDQSSELKKMVRYTWWQVKTNADGNVIEAQPASDALNSSSSAEYVTEYGDINRAVEVAANDTVLYLTKGGPNIGATNGFKAGDLLKVEGNNTLAVTSQAGSGIHFKDDVNVVLQYWNRNKNTTDIMAGEGIDDLKDMVKIVNGFSTETPGRGNASYYVSALIEHGFATNIVIYDSYNNYKRPGGTVNTGIYALTLGPVFDGAEVYVDQVLRKDGKVELTTDGKTTVYSDIGAGSEVYISMPKDYAGSVERASYKVNGVDVEQYTSKTIQIPSMTNNVKLLGFKTAFDANEEKTYTLHFDPSITVGKFYEDKGSSSGGVWTSNWVEVTPLDSSNKAAGEYDFQVSQNVVAVDVKTNVANHVFASSDANVNVITTSAGNWSVNHDSASKKFVFSGRGNNDMWVHEAVYVELDGSGSADGVGYTSTTLVKGDTGTALFVAANTTTGAFDMPSGSGAITGLLATNTLTGTNVAGGLAVEGDDVVLYGAYKLTLDGVKAKVHASDADNAAAVAIDATTYVKKGASIKPDASVTGKPTHAVNAAGAEVTTKQDNLAANVTWTAKAKIEIKADAPGAIKIKNAAGEIPYVGGAADVTFYAAPGETFTVTCEGAKLQVSKDGSTNWTENGGTAANIPDGVTFDTDYTAKISVKTADIYFDAGN